MKKAVHFLEIPFIIPMYIFKYYLLFPYIIYLFSNLAYPAVATVSSVLSFAIIIFHQ